MSTHSMLIAKFRDEKYRTIYVHFDGDTIGELLVNHYNNQDIVEKLIDLGNASFLHESIETVDGHSFETPVEGLSVFYGRDRGEDDQKAKVFSCVEFARNHAKKNGDYIYEWDGQKWHGHTKFNGGWSTFKIK